MRRRQNREKILEDGGEGLKHVWAKGKKPLESKIEGTEEMESLQEAKS